MSRTDRCFILQKRLNFKTLGQGMRSGGKGISFSFYGVRKRERMAHHYDAVTPFSAVIKNVSGGEHEMRVEVDNCFTQDSALHVPLPREPAGQAVRRKETGYEAGV